MIKATVFLCYSVILFNYFESILCQDDQVKDARPKCESRIYQQCNHPTHFTDEELENVRKFLNYSYTRLANVRPDKPLCKKLHVRQDWKCLTDDQKRRTIDVWKKLYESGVVQRLTDIHSRYWPAWHKTAEFQHSHRWLNNQFEKEMRKIDPTLALPYWEASTIGTQPERSSIWDTFGRNGSYSNGYCVGNGMFKEWNVVPCVKRHWSPRGVIYPWYTPEFITYLLHSDSYQEMSAKTFGLHFQPHLNAGGFEGQMSVSTAPYDLLFYLYHNAFVDILGVKWHLSRKEFLTPLSYDFGNFVLDETNGNLISGSINSKLTAVAGVSLKEVFWLGFGDYCYIADQLVRPINNIMRGQTDPIPTALKRMPKTIVNKYFPAFLKGNVSSLMHMFEEVGDCNQECRPIPRPTFMKDTENGRRQIGGFRYESGYDMSVNLGLAEKMIEDFWADLTKSKYCSPYVTSYM